MGKIMKTNENVGLSAPWYEFQRILAYTIGQSGEVSVSQIDTSNYQITVTAILEDTAKALASTLQLEVEMGNITITLAVVDGNGKRWVPNPEPMNNSYLTDYLKDALTNNPLVFEISEFNSQVAICCTPNIIQFWNDDLSNPYGCTSMLASEGFRRIFKKEISVYTLGKNIGNF